MQLSDFISKPERLPLQAEISKAAPGEEVKGKQGSRSPAVFKNTHSNPMYNWLVWLTIIWQKLLERFCSLEDSLNNSFHKPH